MSAIHFIDTNPLDLTTIQAIIFEGKKLALSTSTQDKINACRLFLDEKTKSISKLLYVINTGFGALYNVKISDNNLQKLQENLVKSHACGTGEEVPKEIVKLMLLFKIQSLSYGHSVSNNLLTQP